MRFDVLINKKSFPFVGSDREKDFLSCLWVFNKDQRKNEKYQVSRLGRALFSLLFFLFIFSGNCKPIIFVSSSFSMPQSHVSVINMLGREEKHDGKKRNM